MNPDTTDLDRTGEDSDTPESIITARGLGLTGDRGRVYGPVDLDVARGGLTVLRGHPGNGRTCLLLALAGRMKHSEGTLVVDGETRAQDIFRKVAIAGFSDIDSLDPAVTVRTVLAEQRAWMSPFWHPRRQTTEEDLDSVLTPVFGDHRLPSLRTRVGDMTELDRMLLRVSLAWSEGAEILVVDDLEQVRVHSERAFLATRLAELGRTATVVTSAVADLPPDSPDHRLVTLPATKEGL